MTPRRPLRAVLITQDPQVRGAITSFVRDTGGGLAVVLDLDVPLAGFTGAQFKAVEQAAPALVFIDFEYFGWDDPAKTVADFFLQPAVPVPREQRLPFFRAVAGFYGPGLERRLPLVYGYLSLKWCLIILNVFLRPGAPDPAARDRQLGRARSYLDRVRGEFATKTFPFGLE
jgi:hypothetical protein